MKGVPNEYKAKVWTDPVVSWTTPQASWATVENQYANGLAVTLKVTKAGPQKVVVQSFDGKYYSVNAVADVLAIFIDKPSVLVEWRDINPVCIGEWIDTPKGRMCTKWSSPTKQRKPYLVWNHVSTEHVAVSYYEIFVGGVVFRTVSNSASTAISELVNPSMGYSVRACESGGLCGGASAVVEVGASG
jgi:hypothetical protein